VKRTRTYQLNNGRGKVSFVTFLCRLTGVASRGVATIYLLRFLFGAPGGRALPNFVTGSSLDLDIRNLTRRSSPFIQRSGMN
jgi:hypothetical protein